MADWVSSQGFHIPDVIALTVRARSSGDRRPKLKFQPKIDAFRVSFNALL